MDTPRSVRILKVLLSCLLCGVTDSAQATPLPLALQVGEQRILPVPRSNRFSVGAPHALLVQRLDAEHLLLRAQAPLRTTLILQTGQETQEFPVWIDPAPTGALVPNLRSALRELGLIPHLQAIAVEGGFILQGEISRLQDLQHIARALDLAPPPLLRSQITLSEPLLRAGHTALTRGLAALPGPHPPLEWVLDAGTLILRGSFATQDDRRAAQRALKQFFPYWEDETQILGEPSRTAHFRVYLLEVERTRALSLGLRPPSSTGGGLTALPIPGLNLTPWELRLEHLQRAGELQILSAPEISVLTPGEGEFFSGGEIPIRTHNRFATQVQWKPYGLSLKIKTVSASAGQIRFEIQTEASHLDTANAMDGVPAIRSNRLRTEIQALFGAPLLLTGLVQTHDGESNEGLPFLSAIPGLGRLFSAQSDTHTQRELVVSVIAHAAPPPLASERIAQALPREPIALRWVQP